MNKLLILAGCVAGVTASAVTGALATDPDSTYYRTLVKPSWQPPPPVYGIVWTPLYADIALSAGHGISTLVAAGSGPRAAKSDRGAGRQPGAQHRLVVVVLPRPSAMARRRGVRGAHAQLGRPGAAGRRGRPTGRARAHPVSGVVCVRHRADGRDRAAQSGGGDHRTTRRSVACASGQPGKTIAPVRGQLTPGARRCDPGLSCGNNGLTVLIGTVMTALSTRRRPCLEKVSCGFRRGSCTAIAGRLCWSERVRRCCCCTDSAATTPPGRR